MNAPTVNGNSLPNAKVIKVSGTSFAIGLQWLRLPPHRLTRDAEKLARGWSADAFVIRKGFTPQVGMAGGVNAKWWERVRAAAPAAVEVLGGKWIGLWLLADGTVWGASCFNGEILADADRIFAGREDALDWLHNELAVTGGDADYRIICPDGWYQGGEQVTLEAVLLNSKARAPILVPRQILWRGSTTIAMGGILVIATFYLVAPAIDGILSLWALQETPQVSNNPAQATLQPPAPPPPQMLSPPDPPSFEAAPLGDAIRFCILDIERVEAMLPPGWKGGQHSCSSSLVEAVATTSSVSPRLAAANHLEKMAPSGCQWAWAGESGRELKLGCLRSSVGDARGRHDLMRLTDADLALRDISDYWTLKVRITPEAWQPVPDTTGRTMTAPTWKVLKWEIDLPFAVEHLSRDKVLGSLPGLVLTKISRGQADQPWHMEGRIYVR